jgi:hypothetical protein
MFAGDVPLDDGGVAIQGLLERVEPETGTDGEIFILQLIASLAQLLEALFQFWVVFHFALLDLGLGASDIVAELGEFVGNVWGENGVGVAQEDLFDEVAGFAAFGVFQGFGG